MVVQASDANTEKLFSKGFAATSWNGTRTYLALLTSLGKGGDVSSDTD
jgi:hypothetical protein